MRKAALLILGLLLCLAILILGLNAWVIASSRAFITGDMAQLPDNAVGLLLGTSRYTRDGHSNPHFNARVSAAAALYKAGKISRLLVSGANPSVHYNEPREMFQALVKAGIPPKSITLDFAGFRTLDSVVRAQAVFGQSKLTIISQRYHDYRAVFIARHKGIDAVAFTAAPVSAHALNRVILREYLARVRAVLDLFVLHTQPRFLGQPVKLNTGKPA